MVVAKTLILWVLTASASLMAWENPERPDPCANEIIGEVRYNEFGFPIALGEIDERVSKRDERYQGRLDENGRAILEWGDGTVGEDFVEVEENNGATYRRKQDPEGEG